MELSTNATVQLSKGESSQRVALQKSLPLLGCNCEGCRVNLSAFRDRRISDVGLLSRNLVGTCGNQIKSQLPGYREVDWRRRPSRQYAVDQPVMEHEGHRPKARG